MLMEVSRRKLLHRMHTKRRKAGKKGETVFDKILCSFLYISKRWWAGGEGKGMYCQREDKTKEKEMKCGTKDS